MKSIFTLLQANIKHKEGAFKSIIVLMTLITIAFTCIISNDDNIDRELLSSFDNTDIGDLLITVEEEDMNEQLEGFIINNSHVSRMRVEELIAVNGNVELAGEKMIYSDRLVKYNDNLRVFNDTCDGFEEKVVLESGEVFVSYTIATACSAKKGDTLVIDTSYGKETFIVAGFTEDPIYGSCVLAPENFFINSQDFERIKAERLDNESAAFKNLQIVYMIHVYNNGEISDLKLEKELNEDCGIIDKSILHTTKDSLATFTKLYSDVGIKVFFAFVILLIIVVIITIHNSINTSVEIEYVNLGILKAQGFSTWHIRFTYILQYTLALIIGMMIGLLVSIPLTKLLGGIFLPFTGILTYGELSILKCLAISIVLIVICMMFALISTIKIGKLSPVRAVRGGGDDVYFASRVQIPIKKKLLMFFIAIRQLTSKFASYMGACAIIAILVFFMISVGVMSKGLSYDTLFASMGNVKATLTMYDNFNMDDMEVVRTSLTNKYPLAGISYYTSYNVTAENVTYWIDVTEDVELWAKIYKGRAPQYQNEIAATEIFAEEAGKHIGDTIKVHTESGTQEYIITGYYQTTSHNGRTFIMNYEGGKRLNIPVESGYLFYDGSEEEVGDIVNWLNNAYGDTLVAETYEIGTVDANYIDQISNMLNLVVILVYTVSCLFTLLVVIMLCNKALLREQNDIGIYKAQGFFASSLRLQFAVRFTTVAFIGSLVGIMLSQFLTAPMFSVLLRIIGITNFTSYADFGILVMPTVIICLCVFVFSYMVSYKVKKVEVRQLIVE